MDKEENERLEFEEARRRAAATSTPRPRMVVDEVEPAQNGVVDVDDNGIVGEFFQQLHIYIYFSYSVPFLFFYFSIFEEKEDFCSILPSYAILCDILTNSTYFINAILIINSQKIHSKAAKLQPILSEFFSPC